MYDVLILSHSSVPIGPESNYTVNLMARLFVESGLKVGYQKGLSGPPRALAVVNQVDLTITPPEYVRFLRKFPVSVNGRLTDISKHLVCRETLVNRDDPYDGPVIVKTNLNYGGLPEKKARVHTRKVKFAAYYLKARLCGAIWGDYPMYPNPGSVPVGVWENPDLVVQRLKTERDEQGRYCLRCWYVLGDRGFHVMTMSHKPVVKGKDILDRRVLDIETPPALEAVRRKLGVDFGRLDYVLAGGEVVLFDVNRTPTSTPAAVEHYQPQWRDMALGISAYLDFSP